MCRFAKWERRPLTAPKNHVLSQQGTPTSGSDVQTVGERPSGRVRVGRIIVYIVVTGPLETPVPWPPAMTVQSPLGWLLGTFSRPSRESAAFFAGCSGQSDSSAAVWAFGRSETHGSHTAGAFATLSASAVIWL